MSKLLVVCVLFFTTNAVAAYDRPSGPNVDLTKEIDFHRSSVYPLGPTGIHGWLYTTNQMTHHARQILVTKIEKGSPADGVVQVGDVILGVGGELFDADARRLMGEAIDVAEAVGEMTLTRWRPVKPASTRQGVEEEVTLKLRRRLPFRNSAPYDCVRSRDLLDESLARLVAQCREKKYGRLQENLLVLMAAGRPEHLKIVADALREVRWAKPDFKISVERGGMQVWSTGMNGLILAEYYLLTKDESVLPALTEHVVKAAMGQSGGGLWGHSFAYTSINEGRLHGSLKGYGALNLAGLPCLLALVLAEECGIEHPEIDAALDRALPFFANFVGHGTIGYGYHRPNLDKYNNGHNGFSSNGKNAIANLVFSAAGDRDTSHYYSKLLTSSYDEREYGHAGNSFNQFWGVLGVNCGGPKAVQAFHKEMRWYNALLRGWDGTMRYQQLAGYYGGPTLSLDAARVMANAVPLRKLVITGRNSKTKMWLSDKQVDQAIDAGRWHWADYSERESEELIAALDCWSVGAREWIAEELGRRDSVIPLLRETLRSKRGDLRAGACSALGYQRERAASAVDDLINALGDDYAPVQVAAAHALMRIGPAAYRSVPAFLEEIIACEDESTLAPVLQALSYTLGGPPARTAPLYYVGMVPSMPEGMNPLDGVDRAVLYPAMRRMMQARSARVRDCGMTLLKHFDRDDVAAMATDIYLATKYRAPDMGMFAGAAKGRGMWVMAAHQLSDGPEIIMDALEARVWGAFWREPHHFEVLQAYGSTAKKMLPRLKDMRWSRRTGEKRDALEAAIRAIETDGSKHVVTSLMAMTEGRLEKVLSSAKDDRARVKQCRALLKAEPDNVFQRVAVLKQLVQVLGEEAVDDVLAALTHESDMLRAEAVALAVGMNGASVESSDFWLSALRKSDDPRYTASVLMVIGERGGVSVDDCASYVTHDVEEIRLAAIACVARLGGDSAVQAMIENLGEEMTVRERTAYERAISRSYKGRSGDLAKSLSVALDDQSRVSLVRALGRMDEEAARALLFDVVAGEHAEARKIALEALATSGGASIASRLLTLAEGESNARLKSSFIEIALRRAVCGRVPEKQRVALLTTISKDAKVERQRDVAREELSRASD